MIQIKLGVNMSGLQPEMAIVIPTAASVLQDISETYPRVADVDLVVTSAIDGKHSRASLHYVGFALDFRTRALKEIDTHTAILFYERLRRALGDQYDVVLEKSHLHVEFQPKK